MEVVAACPLVRLVENLLALTSTYDKSSKFTWPYFAAKSTLVTNSVHVAEKHQEVSEKRYLLIKGLGRHLDCQVPDYLVCDSLATAWHFNIQDWRIWCHVACGLEHACDWPALPM